MKKMGCGDGDQRKGRVNEVEGGGEKKSFLFLRWNRGLQSPPTPSTLTLLRVEREWRGLWPKPWSLILIKGPKNFKGQGGQPLSPQRAQSPRDIKTPGRH